MGTFAGSNESKAVINTKSTSNIKFGLTAQETVLAGFGVVMEDSRSYINARETEIVSDIRQSLHTNAFSETVSAGSDTKAYSFIYSMDNEQKIVLNNVFVGGIDRLLMKTMTSRMQNSSSAYAASRAQPARRRRIKTMINRDDDKDAAVAQFMLQILLMWQARKLSFRQARPMSSTTLWSITAAAKEDCHQCIWSLSPSVFPVTAAKGQVTTRQDSQPSSA